MPIVVTLLVRTLVCIVMFLMFDGAALAQGRRVALVIGVSNYKNVPTLANTANDANSIGAALRRLGFAVDLVIDPDRNAMESSIRNLGRKAEGRIAFRQRTFARRPNYEHSAVHAGMRLIVDS